MNTFVKLHVVGLVVMVCYLLGIYLLTDPATAVKPIEGAPAVAAYYLLFNTGLLCGTKFFDTQA